MTYTFEKGCMVCAGCGAKKLPPHDRHACFWRELEEMPIGSAALSLVGQFRFWNRLEQRIAKGIWERVKCREKPKTLKKYNLIVKDNFEVWRVWVARGDAAIQG